MLLWTSGCTYLFKLVFLFSLDIYPGVKLLDYRTALFSVFLRNFHDVFHNTCYNLHSHKQCWSVPFSLHFYWHLLYLFFLIVAIVTRMRKSLWFWSTFRCWLVMLSTVSGTCWPFVCLLGKLSIQFFSPYFNCVICSFDIVCMISLYTLNVNFFLVDGKFANIFSHSIGYLFILLSVSCGM